MTERDDMTPTRGEPVSKPVTEGALDDVFESLQGELARRRTTRWGRLRERITSWPTAARRRVMVVIALVLPAAALLSPRTDWPIAPSLQLAVLLLFCIALTGPLLSRAMRGWHEPLVRPLTTLAWVLGTAAGLTLLLALPLDHALLPYTRAADGGGLLRQALPCLFYGLGYAVPVYLGARLLGHGTPGSRLFAATAAGISGNLALLFHCAITEPSHRVTGHATVLAVTLLLAWLIGRTTGGRRRASS